MNVSIIIPAYNSAATLAQTLDSLLSQTVGHWEAIIVDDGSKDTTTEIAGSYIDRDSRIRLVSQENAGAAAARNKGVDLARFDWLLFLDADDWILPRYLERMTGRLREDPTLDAVHCGFKRVAANGELGPEIYAPKSRDLFPELANMCVLTIHCVVFRKSLISLNGGLDLSLVNCEDWDLWQRIARAGARFGAVNEALARYRTSPGSLSRKAVHTLVNGLRIIDRGHSKDDRVKAPVLKNAEGLSRKGLSIARLYFAIWPAALMLGSGYDARPLLDKVKEDSDSELDPKRVAATIYEAALLPEGLPSGGWHELWPRIQHHMTVFLHKLEKQSMSAGLAKRTLDSLELMILEHPRGSGPRSVGKTYIIELEVSEPISDIIPPKGIERIYFIIQLEGERLGHLSLPIIDGVLLSYVLVDAIANKFAWSILGQFFRHNVYGNLRTDNGPDGLSIYRGNLCLARGLPEDGRPVWIKAHEEVGWLMFLQEVWGKPEWTKDCFYDPHAKEEPGERRISDNGWLIIEVSQRLPQVKATWKKLNVLFTVGGVSIGAITLSRSFRTKRAQELRAALMSESGSELLTASVREGLMGRKLIGSASLRERLAYAAKNNSEATLHELSNAPSLSKGASSMLYRRLDPDASTVLIGRWYPGLMTSTISRRAALPAETVKDFMNAAPIAGHAILQNHQSGAKPKSVVYAPDLIMQKSGDNVSFVISNRQSEKISAKHSEQKNKPEPFLTEQLPILVYNHITPDESDPRNQYKLTTQALEEQLRYLHGEGYYSVSIEELHYAMHTKTPFPGRAVIITFDNGDSNFLIHAWPLLKRYNLSAIVFISANDVGNPEGLECSGENRVSMLDWIQIRQLRNEGVEFGSYFSLNQPLSLLSHAEIVREGIRSRTIIEREIEKPVLTIAYPLITVDDKNQYQTLAEETTSHLLGVCGYLYGLTHNNGLTGRWENPMTLPRIEVRSDETIKDFVRKLNK